MNTKGMSKRNMHKREELDFTSFDLTSRGVANIRVAGSIPKITWRIIIGVLMMALVNSLMHF